MTHAPHQRFDAGADVYARARPAYPAEAIEWTLATAGAGDGAPALDLAAGTGALTAPLIDAGLTVTAVEPSAEMRRILLDRAPEATVVDALAEDLPAGDDSFDLVTVANALHWFDPKAAYEEIRRVIAPGGHLAVLWNVEDRDGPTSRAIDNLKLRLLGDSPTRGAHEGEPLMWDRHFETVAERQFKFIHRPPSIAEYVSSWSYVAIMDEAERAAFLADALDGLPAGPVDLPFRVTVTLGRPLAGGG